MTSLATQEITMEKAESGAEDVVYYKRKGFGRSDVFRQFWQNKEFLDAKVASKFEPDKVLQGHRIILAATSKYLQQQFRKNPDTKKVILVGAVEHKHLELFFQLVYEGEIKVPGSEFDCFKATLRALNVRFGEEFDKILVDDGTPEDFANISASSQSCRMSTENPLENQVNSTFETPPISCDEQPSTSTDTLEFKAFDPRKNSDVPIMRAPREFREKVTKNSKRLYVEEFPENRENEEAPSRKKPSFVPLVPLSTRSDDKIARSQLGLFWIERITSEFQKVEELEIKLKDYKVKKIMLCKSGSSAFIGFETAKDAIDFKNRETLTKNIECKPLQSLPLDEIFDKDKNEINRKDKTILIKNIPCEWNVMGIGRILRKKKIHYESLEFNGFQNQATVKILGNDAIVTRAIKTFESAKMVASILESV